MERSVDFFCGRSWLRNPGALQMQRICGCEKWLSPHCACRPAFDCTASCVGEIARRVGPMRTVVRPPPKAKSKLKENVEIAEWPRNSRRAQRASGRRTAVRAISVQSGSERILARLKLKRRHPAGRGHVVVRAHSPKISPSLPIGAAKMRNAPGHHSGGASPTFEGWDNVIDTTNDRLHPTQSRTTQARSLCPRQIEGRTCSTKTRIHLKQPNPLPRGS